MSSITTEPPPATAAPVLKPASSTPVARPASNRPKIVVVGGGFAGLEAVKKFKGENVDVTLIDRSNHHLFQPLLYQVGDGGPDAREHRPAAARDLPAPGQTSRSCSPRCGAWTPPYVRSSRRIW